MKILKSLKSKVLLGALASVVIAGAQVGTAAAWTYAITGTGACQPDGSFQITWNVDNSKEKDALHITNSSNPVVVPIDTKVPAHQSANFEQKADGTKPATFSLTLTGNWKGDRKNRTRSGEVTLKEACPQPAPQVKGTSTQVKAPVGAVSAGQGGSLSTNAGAVIGSVASVAVAGLGFGLRRFSKDV